MKTNIFILCVSAFLFASLAVYHIVVKEYLLSMIFGGLLIGDIGLIWDNHRKI
ncbi:MAG: hypothetical protein ACO388_10360 [Saprospiraceae bacterium]